MTRLPDDFVFVPRAGAPITRTTHTIDVLDLPEGPVTLAVPLVLSGHDFSVLERWLSLALETMTRRAELRASREAADEGDVPGCPD